MNCLFFSSISNHEFNAKEVIASSHDENLLKTNSQMQEYKGIYIFITF